MTQPATSETPKDASPFVVAQQAAMLNMLPFSDTRDFDDASRGFLGTLENAEITNPQGRVVWSSSLTASCPTRRRRRPSTPACGGNRGST